MTRWGEIDAWLAEVVADPSREGCRLWPFGTSNRPHRHVAGRFVYVSHIVLELDGRPRPTPGAYALHSCDIDECCAPWHLRWGDQFDNMADARKRGRLWAKLTLAQREQVAVDLRPTRFVAAEFGISRQRVRTIRREHRTITQGANAAP